LPKLPFSSILDQWKPVFTDLQPSIFFKVVGVFDDFYGFPDSTFEVVILTTVDSPSNLNESICFKMDKMMEDNIFLIIYKVS
jgi:hypothetical protein